MVDIESYGPNGETPPDPELLETLESARNNYFWIVDQAAKPGAERSPLHREGLPQDPRLALPLARNVYISSLIDLHESATPDSNGHFLQSEGSKLTQANNELADLAMPTSTRTMVAQTALAGFVRAVSAHNGLFGADELPEQVASWAFFAGSSFVAGVNISGILGRKRLTVPKYLQEFTFDAEASKAEIIEELEEVLITFESTAQTLYRNNKEHKKNLAKGLLAVAIPPVEVI